MMWAQMLCRFIVDKEVELRHILFNDSGDEYVVCRQNFIFLTLKFVVVLMVYIFYQADCDMNRVAHLLERNIWVIVVVAVEL